MVKIADRIYLIIDGKVVCHGTPERLIRDPVAIDAYLGSTFEDDVLMARVAGFSKARRDEPPEPDAGTPAKPPPKPPAGGPADHREPETQPDLEPIPLDPIGWPDSEPPPAPSRPAARSRPPAPPPTAPAPVLVDSFPASRPNSTAIPNAPAPAAKLSGGVQQLLEHEKMRRLVEQLRDRNHMPTAWHELAGRGTAAVPVLLEALERREMEIRHLAFRLLESVTGER